MHPSFIIYFFLINASQYAVPTNIVPPIIFPRVTGKRFPRKKLLQSRFAISLCFNPSCKAASTY